MSSDPIVEIESIDICCTPLCVKQSNSAFTEDSVATSAIARESQLLVDVVVDGNDNPLELSLHDDIDIDVSYVSNGGSGTSMDGSLASS